MCPTPEGNASTSVASDTISLLHISATECILSSNSSSYPGIPASLLSECNPHDQVMEWQATLGEVETVLKVLLTVQRQWTSLEAIFLTSKDIRAQLPDDTRR